MSEPITQDIKALAGDIAPDADGFRRISVGAHGWSSLACACAEGPDDLIALWTDGTSVFMALSSSLDRSIRAIVSLTLADGRYPAVGHHHAPAIRIERAMRDLHGVTPVDLPDDRPWLDHGTWPPVPAAKPGTSVAPNAYRFLPVEGEGVHQIPVGPIHAGIIEPGHFRFTANGELVVRLEERLGYTHKGTEALLVGKTVSEAQRIVGRISGDSTVAYAFAFARAVEAATGIMVPQRAELLRAIMAELERIAQHINDFGAICNDASAVVINAHCTLQREHILAACAECFGHRLMMDRIVPGGVATDLKADGISLLKKTLDESEKTLNQAVQVYDDSPSILDRTVTTGRLAPELAARFAAGGFVGRASGRDFDSRRDAPYPPYDRLGFKIPVRDDGDVHSRALIRSDEAIQSIALVHQLLDMLEPGPIQTDTISLGSGDGAALVEGFRGDVFVAVRLDDTGRIAHAHARDPSQFQWPLLEAAIEGNIVADFPLCNKSFNCSYSGHDM